MHRLLVPASPAQDCSVVAVWIAEAVDRGEKVLYKHAPSEDAAAVLGRSLSAVGLDRAVLMTGQVQLADTDALGSRPVVFTRRSLRCTSSNWIKRTGKDLPDWR